MTSRRVNGKSGLTAAQRSAVHSRIPQLFDPTAQPIAGSSSSVIARSDSKRTVLDAPRERATGGPQQALSVPNLPQTAPQTIGWAPPPPPAPKHVAARTLLPAPAHPSTTPSVPEKPLFNQEFAQQKTNLAVSVRPYSCDVCGRAFARNSDLIRHNRIHSNEKPYLCPFPNCPKAFVQRSALTVHIRVHTGEKPHKCNECDKAFGDSSSLARHRRIHTGRRPYLCGAKDCGKTFCRKTTLIKHISKHHNDLPVDSQGFIAGQPAPPTDEQDELDEDDEMVDASLGATSTAVDPFAQKRPSTASSSRSTSSRAVLAQSSQVNVGISHQQHSSLLVSGKLDRPQPQRPHTGFTMAHKKTSTPQSDAAFYFTPPHRNSYLSCPGVGSSPRYADDSGFFDGKSSHSFQALLTAADVKANARMMKPSNTPEATVAQTTRILCDATDHYSLYMLQQDSTPVTRSATPLPPASARISRPTPKQDTRMVFSSGGRLSYSHSHRVLVAPYDPPCQPQVLPGSFTDHARQDSHGSDLYNSFNMANDASQEACPGPQNFAVAENDGDTLGWNRASPARRHSFSEVLVASISRSRCLNDDETSQPLTKRRRLSAC